MITMTLGVFAIVMLVISGSCLYYKRLFWSFISSLAAIFLTYWTAHSWKIMLVSSGKDTTLLGFYRYPAASVILFILFFLAEISMFVSFILMRRKRKTDI